MIQTVTNVPINDELLQNYFHSLVNCFYKILPIREDGEKTLPIYIRSLQVELIGCESLICSLKNDAGFVTLLSILQYFLDNPDCPIADVRREVFRAISICNKLERKHTKAVDK
nr:MAG TPA: hypothetical protein [Caudoviricetes sp.]